MADYHIKCICALQLIISTNSGIYNSYQVYQLQKNIPTPLQQNISDRAMKANKSRHPLYRKFSSDQQEIQIQKFKHDASDSLAQKWIRNRLANIEIQQHQPRNNQQKNAKTKKKNQVNKQNEVQQIQRINIESDQDIVAQNKNPQIVFFAMPQLILISPVDVVYWEATRKKLTLLDQVFSQDQLILLMETKNQKHGINNLRQLKKIDKQHLWFNVVPKMISHVLKYSRQLSAKQYMLVKNVPAWIQIKKFHVFLMLAHMFFGTFPRQVQNTDVSLGKLMTVNDDEDQVNDKKRLTARMDKLKCILTYFIKAQQAKQKLIKMEQGLTIKRVNLQLPNNKNGKNKIQLKHDFISRKKIRLLDDNIKVVIGNALDFEGTLLVYADGRVGRQVFGTRCVQNQENIFFSHPQLLVLKILAEQLQESQALLVSGAQKICECRGEDDDFTYIKAIREQNEQAKNSYKQLETRQLNCNGSFAFVNTRNMIDVQKDPQFNRIVIQETIMSVYIAVNNCEQSVVTGPWMCQRYGLDQELTFIIQWISATMAGKNLIYVLAKGQQKKMRTLKRIIRQLKEYNYASLINLFEEYYKMVFEQNAKLSLSEYINLIVF